MPNDAGDSYSDVPPVLDAAAIARIFGVVHRVAARWLCRGEIPSAKIGKKRYALREDVINRFKAGGPGR